MRDDIIKQKENILEWISENQSKAEIAKKLNCKVHTLSLYLKKMNIVYTGNQGGKGHKAYESSRYIPYKEYIKGKSVQTNKLRKKLIREGYKKHICEKCGNEKWNGVPIPLEVHHKNGKKNDNELNNLELLCPNCHALTDNYRGKNIQKNK